MTCRSDSGQAFANSLQGFANALVSGWSVNSIVTLQAGFPFTPQLSYNPSNNGDTRNPVRPFVNPNFTGNPILGNADAVVQSRRVSAAAAQQRILRQSRPRQPDRSGTRDVGLLRRSKTHAIHERLTLQFRAEIFNLLNRANFNTPNLIVFTPSGSFGHGRSDHQHFDHGPAGAIRLETSLVGRSRSVFLEHHFG